MRGQPVGLGAKDGARPGLRQCERNGRGGGRRALECRRSRIEWDHTFSLGGFERYELDHGSAAHLTVLLCFTHCCHAVGTAAAKAYLFCSFRKEERRSMRIDLDKKPTDGMAIAFVVIALLTPVTLAILLSRLHAVF
jgi:hypothetical protein